MNRTPEENEATLHRAVEQAQRERWEPEDDEESDLCDEDGNLPDEINCAWCSCDMGRGAGYKSVSGDLCCSIDCADAFNEDAMTVDES